MSNKDFKEINVKNLVTEMVGCQLNETEIKDIVFRINNEFKSKNLKDINITPNEMITWIENDKYFLKTINDINYDPEYLIVEIEKNRSKEIPLKDKNNMDLSFSFIQYQNSVKVIKDYMRKTEKYSYGKIKKIIESDVDLFVSSYSNAISDTFSREYFIDQLRTQ